MPPRKKIEHDEVVKRFARKLQELRIAAAMSQSELASAAACTAAYVSRLERGGAAPGIDLVERLAEALGVKMAELLPDADEPDKLETTRERARALFGELIDSDSEAVVNLLAQQLARLEEATRR